MNFETVTRQAILLVKSVGQYIKNEAEKLSYSDIEEKGLHNLVSYVDKEAEKRLVKGLSKLIPESGFIAEENQDLKRTDKYNWIVDPLDGTTNYLHGVPVYSISVALMHQNELVSGIVYEVNRDECFFAWKDGHAYLNERKIMVSATTEPDRTLIATGFPYSDYSKLQAYLDFFQYLIKTTRGLRRLGSAAVDLAYVASGRFDVFFEYGLNPWDVAAGAFIVKQAGGYVTDFNGKENYLFGREIIASNKLIHQDFQANLAGHFNKSN